MVRPLQQKNFVLRKLLLTEDTTTMASDAFEARFTARKGTGSRGGNTGAMLQLGRHTGSALVLHEGEVLRSQRLHNPVGPYHGSDGEHREGHHGGQEAQPKSKQFELENKATEKLIDINKCYTMSKLLYSTRKISGRFQLHFV